jgi:hypothetical protein
MFIGEGVAPQARSGGALLRDKSASACDSGGVEKLASCGHPWNPLMQEPRRCYESKCLSFVDLDSGSVDSTARARRIMSGGWASGSVTKFAR